MYFWAPTSFFVQIFAFDCVLIVNIAQKDSALMRHFWLFWGIYDILQVFVNTTTILRFFSFLSFSPILTKKSIFSHIKWVLTSTWQVTNFFGFFKAHWNFQAFFGLFWPLSRKNRFFHSCGVRKHLQNIKNASKKPKCLIKDENFFVLN